MSPEAIISPTTQRGAGASEAAAPALITPSEVTWGPGPDAFPAGAQFCVLHGDPGAEGRMFTVRLKVSDAYVFAPHSHPHDEHLTIVSGSMLLGNGTRAEWKDARPLGAGSYAFLPRDQFHYAVATEDTVFQVQAIGPFAITYANPEDDPRNAGVAH